MEEIFFKSADEIAKKIDQGFYDLENEACGIKQGVNRQPRNQVNLGGNNEQNQKNICC